jgi:hypothetical protein
LVIIAQAAVKFHQEHYAGMGFWNIYHSVAHIADIKGKILYLVHMATISVYLLATNRPNGAKPSGVWARWKHINDRNRAWIDQFETLV